MSERKDLSHLGGIIKKQEQHEGPSGKLPKTPNLEKGSPKAASKSRAFSSGGSKDPGFPSELMTPVETREAQEVFDKILMEALASPEIGLKLRPAPTVIVQNLNRYFSQRIIGINVSYIKEQQSYSFNCSNLIPSRNLIQLKKSEADFLALAPKSESK